MRHEPVESDNRIELARDRTHMANVGTKRGKHPAFSRWPLSVTLAMLLAVIGLIGLWALFAA